MRKQCNHCGESFDTKFTYAKLCYTCWREKEDAPSIIADLRNQVELLRRHLDDSGIPDDMLRILTMLCHPDKHNGSQAANKATLWLLARRGL